MTAGRSLLGACASLVLALAGCSGDKRPGASPTPAVSGTPTETGSAAPAAIAATWQACTESPTSRQEVAAAAVGDKIYVAGGLDATGDGVAFAEAYDTARDRWSKLPNLPVAAHHAMGTAWRGKFVVLGGNVGGRQSAAVFAFSDGTWSDLPALTSPRAAGTAVAVGDRIVVFGGVGPDGHHASSEIFDGTSWRAGPALSELRDHLAGATDGRLVYVIGGRRDGAQIAAAETIDVATGSRQSLPDLPTPRSGSGATFAERHTIVVGGEGSRIFPEVEAFDPASKAWRRLPDMGMPRHGIGVATVGSTIYALHGGREVGLRPSGACEKLNVSDL